MFDLLPKNKRYRDIFNFENLFSEFIPGHLTFQTESRMMKLDIRENESKYIFEIELPGVDKENIDISILDDVLSISVDKSEESIDENDNYVIKERKFGSYSRSFSIPNIDIDNIIASFKNGVLRLDLPKSTHITTPKKIILID